MFSELAPQQNRSRAQGQNYSFFYVPEVPDEKLRKEEARRRRKFWTYFEEISENLRKPRRFLWVVDWGKMRNFEETFSGISGTEEAEILNIKKNYTLKRWIWEDLEQFIRESPHEG